MVHEFRVEQVMGYKEELICMEKSQATVEKYIGSLMRFGEWIEAGACSKEIVIEYEQHIGKKYAASTANTIIAAFNGFFKYMGWTDCIVKPFKMHRTIFRDNSRELTRKEYYRLLKSAKSVGNFRLFYIMETLCCTGIRISELKYITVEAVRDGYANVNCKGKQRRILLPKKLCCDLKKYCRSRKITFGAVFLTKQGNPVNRSNVWAEMKKICEKAFVDASKVFPHNFRHLFAVCFYEMEKDIAKLADLLGHASIETTRIYVMQSIQSHMVQIERMHLFI